MIGAWFAVWAQGATVSLDVDLSKTLDPEGPFYFARGSGEVEWPGASLRPAAWSTLRVGQQLDLGPVELAPELALGTVFAGTAWYDRNPASEVRTTVGFRAGAAAGPVHPGVYAHAGVGFGGFRFPDAPEKPQHESALTLDAGGFVTMPVSKFDLGLHGGWELFPTWFDNVKTLMGGVSVGLRI